MTSNDVLMQVGDFKFSIPTAAYRRLRLRAEYRWVQQDRLATKPAQQWLGPGRQEIDLPGVIYPNNATLYPDGQGWRQVSLMRDAASQGKPLMLVSGLGEVWGWWCITDVEETRSGPAWRGLARKIDFRLRLVAYGGEPVNQ